MIFIAVIYVLVMPGDIGTELVVAIPAIIGSISLIYFLVISMRNREKPLIKKVINCLDKNKEELYHYIKRLKTFKFPGSLDDWFQLSFDDNLFKIISKTRQRELMKIKDFNDYCDRINEKNKELITKTKSQGIPEYEKKEIEILRENLLDKSEKLVEEIIQLSIKLKKKHHFIDDTNDLFKKNKVFQTLR